MDHRIRLEEFEKIYNPLSYYCRLVDCGMTEKEAKRWGKIYEEGLYKEIIDILKNETFK